MATYRRVYDSRHLQADCQEPGSAPEPNARQSSMGYLYLFTFTSWIIVYSRAPSIVSAARPAKYPAHRSCILPWPRSPLRSRSAPISAPHTLRAHAPCVQYSINTKRELYATFLTPHFQEHQSIISAHFGIESLENLVAIRRNRFINWYGETDN